MRPIFDSRQPSLFDPPQQEPAGPSTMPVAALAVNRLATTGKGEEYNEDDWKEVPQARFLSWSREMQDAYCAARDLSSAEGSEEAHWIQFYLDRREMYLEDMKNEPSR